MIFSVMVLKARGLRSKLNKAMPTAAFSKTAWKRASDLIKAFAACLVNVFLAGAGGANPFGRSGSVRCGAEGLGWELVFGMNNTLHLEQATFWKPAVGSKVPVRANRPLRLCVA